MGCRGKHVVHVDPAKQSPTCAMVHIYETNTDIHVPHRGTFAEEIADEDFTFTNSRRRSNSSNISHNARDFKNKFEVNDPEPVFEESIHGPQEEEEEHTDDLAKTDSSESGRSN